MAIDGGREVVDVLDEGDGFLTAYVERRDSSGEKDGVADRKNGELVAELDDLVVRRPRAASGEPSCRTCE